MSLEVDLSDCSCARLTFAWHETLYSVGRIDEKNLRRKVESMTRRSSSGQVLDGRVLSVVKEGTTLLPRIGFRPAITKAVVLLFGG